MSLLVAALPLRAAELPELGEAARAGLTQAQEAQLGREIMRQVRANRDYLDDPELTEYLNDLGDRLAAVSPAPYRQFSFFAVRDPTINAFALPGGHIGVHTGLISAVRSESELAAVLAHEIAHVTQNHVARMLEAQKSASLASLVALAIAILAARTDSQVSQAAATVGSALTVQQQLDYSRDFEREADRVGLNILTQAGFAPQAMVSFFERLQAQSRVLETHAPAYLRTHPLTYQRIADLQNRVGELPYRQYPDSLEFRLIQAKVWAGEGEPGQALARLESRLAQDARDAASWYGLARAALRAGNLVRAAEAVRRLDGLGVNSPMIDILAMDLAVAQGQAEQAIARGRQALARHSTSRPLVYAYARGLLLGGRAAEALRLVEEQLRTWPEDARLYALKARAHGELGQRFDAHLAQAEASYRQGELAPAIEQLQLALSSGERDFHKLSIAEARLRALRALQQGESGPPRR
ncbi:MAG: M48 family metalloprotease [Thiobacillaceae bacterium]|nr:M48 family metalloprotease [Thiobacillaceae bacterium]MDW8323916.1 M48 family metalloprotease [Burkholderiales bacterium]